MLIDGRAMAEAVVAEIAATVTTLKTPPRLAVFTCAPNFETQKFLTIKQRQAAAAGVSLTVHELPETVALPAVAAAIAAVLPQTDGVVVQFPFPPHLSPSALAALVPASHDADVLSYDGTQTVLLPPVVGAIAVMAETHGLTWLGRRVVVVGDGRLVGRPAAQFVRAAGAHVTVVTKETADLRPALQAAEVVILGAGVPGLLQPEMVPAGVAVFDAGTSEEGGVLVGDAAPTVATKAALFTPVPGGIGPVAVAILLKNVLYFAKHHRNTP